MSDLDLPAELAARFEVLGLLGAGTFGRVLRARDRQLGREVAIKLLRPAFQDGPARDRFRREARTAAGLRHPTLVEVYDHGETSTGECFLVSELVEGIDLAALKDPVAPETVRRWGFELADALATAHRAGVLHRDVKPANIRIDERDRARLLDFGLAHTSEKGTVLTATGILVGTPKYMAPEVLEGAPVSPAADQFALAATLYEVASGASAFPSDRLQQLLADGRHVPLCPAPVLDAADPELAGILRRALEPEPEDRFPDLEAFARALAGDEAAPAPSPTATVAVPALADGRPRRLPALLAMVALGVGAGLLTMAARPRSSSPATTTPPAPSHPGDDGALEAFDQAMERLRAAHDVTAGPSHLHAFESRDELLDPRLSMITRRLREQMAAPLHAGARDRLDALASGLAHLRGDLKMLSEVALGMQLNVLEQGLALASRGVEIQDRQGELLTEMAALSLQLDPWVAQPGCPRAATRLWALGLEERDSQRSAEGALALARGLDQDRATGQVLQGLWDIHRLVFPGGGIFAADSPELQKIVAALQASGRRLEDAGDHDLAFAVLRQALNLAFRDVAYRPPPLRPELFAPVDALVASLREMAPRLTPASRALEGRRMVALAAPEDFGRQERPAGVQDRVQAIWAIGTPLAEGRLP